jgi:hypothetical protein
MASKDPTPSHYKKKIQPFHVIDEYGMKFYLGNILKYIMRCKEKNGLEDLKKARHYIDIAIKKVENGANLNDL